MKRLLFYVIILLILSSFKSNKTTENLNVLIVTGGHKFEKEAFYNMFNSFKNITWQEATHPEVQDLFKNSKIRKYDAVVFYDYPVKYDISIEQKKDIVKNFQKGIPAVFLHHALVSYLNFEEYINIVGGRYYSKEAFIAPDGLEYQSGYTHDVNFKLYLNQNHPICEGINDFEIKDEVYRNYYIEPGITPIIKTKHELCDSIVGWTNKYGKSNTVYILNGHDHNAFENENYRKLIYNAIKWVAEVN